MTLPEVKDISARVDQAGVCARNIAFRLASKTTMKEIVRRIETKRRADRIDFEYVGLLLALMNRTVMDVKAAVGHKAKEV